MSDVQVSVGFRRKTGMHRVIHTFRQILIDHLLDKIAGSLFFRVLRAFRIYRLFQLFIAHIPDLSSSKHRL